jgi:6-phosphogluconate dehydrogenase
MSTDKPMQLGMVGLGRMGLNMVGRILRDPCHAVHEVVAYDRDPDAVAKAAAQGATGVSSLVNLVLNLTAPRRVWLMLPVDITGKVICELAPLLEDGDMIINGANDYPHHDLEYAEFLRPYGVRYIDVGVSGGVLGGDEGYGMSAGGSEDDIAEMMPVFMALKPDSAGGFSHAGDIGYGHLVKIIHNLIEYGQMRTLNEGYALLKAFGVRDVGEVLDGWSDGTIIMSRLLDLLREALADGDGSLERYSPRVPNGGTGLEAMILALKAQVPTPVLAAALQARLSSCDVASDADLGDNAMRYWFGAHKDALAEG